MPNDLRYEEEGTVDDSREEIAQMFETVGKQVRGINLDEENEGDDGPKVVDEIESLCMNCHKNVCRSVVACVWVSLMRTHASGSDPSSLDEDSVLSRNNTNVILLR